jgi:two-component system, sensor histidine kinase and response regulator
MGSNANDNSTDAFILVIDDSPTQADYLRLMLEKNGFRVWVAGNGRQALAVLEERMPEIIITDVLMPDMDGFEFCRRIKGQERFSDIPVIILTSLSDPHDVIKGLESGADNFVTKPCEEKYLIPRIEHLKEERYKPRCISMPKFMEFSIDGHEYQISSDRRQILNLFLSTYEAAYHKNLELRKAKDELRELNARLEASNKELEAANQELESFGHTVSHDLKQPLQIISGYSQALTQICGDTLNAECKSYLKEITNRTFRMSELITTLLNFSKLTHIEVKSESIDLSGMAQIIAGELRMTAPERKVIFKIQEGLKAAGDKRLMQLVLQNLMGNAWKFSSKREEAVIEFGATEIGGNLAFFVRDNGDGFAMHDHDKLFTPFKRFSTEHDGHGVGLATVQRIIKRHSGQIWAEGEPGKGATFYFTI